MNNYFAEDRKFLIIKLLQHNHNIPLAELAQKLNVSTRTIRNDIKVLNDILGYKNRKIYQDTDCFSFSLDSIILANYCNIRLRDKKVADFCSGNGIVSLILTKRTLATIDGIEIQKKLYQMA